MGEHLIVAPIVLPLLAGALLLLLERTRPAWVPGVSLGATAALLAVAVALLLRADTGAIDAYLLSNWRAPFGIALALDRLSALMLVLTAFVALVSVLYARGGDEARGPHFHTLFQIQLMGLNGAFLTADLFNLFVFFEVLLIASYGLLLHGAGAARLRASIHYVSFNLTGSALFLIAVSLLYGLTGTLNMADLAQRVPAAAQDNALLVHSAGLLLLVVFCVKAAALPLYFWLPGTYSAASAPVAALFAIMTKVGVYAIARVFTLVPFSGTSWPASDGMLAEAPWLLWFALATLLLGAIGALAARALRVLVANLVIASAGTLLTALALGTGGGVAAGLFYLVNSTLVAAALFLLVDRVAAAREAGDRIVPSAFGGERLALGALFFVVAIAVAGLPPLAGFLGKALLLQAAAQTGAAVAVWAIVLVAGFVTLFALARTGAVVFWETGDDPHPRSAPIAVPQALAIATLTVAIAAASVAARPLADYAQAAAAQLADGGEYRRAVLGEQPAPPAYRLRDELGWGKPK